MKNTKDILSKIIIFTVGAAAGSAVTWKFLKNKYEKIAQEEIDSVKEKLMPANLKNEDNNADEDAPEMYYETTKEENQQIYERLVKDSGYLSNKQEEEDTMDKPYVVSPEDFGEVGYPTITLWYYADGVVTNERNKIVTNVDECIGLESLNHFGDYEDDAVHVRNDVQEIDYEILKDRRNFSEIS